MATKPTRDALSSRMSRIRKTNTKPEMVVRRLVHGMGFRFRLHRRDLPGTPDLVFPRLRKVVFVHGCFWHGHGCARGARAPKANAEYWRSKISRNRARDTDHLAALKKGGWRVAVIWECEIKDLRRVERRLAKFLA